MEGNTNLNYNTMTNATEEDFKLVSDAFKALENEIAKLRDENMVLRSHIAEMAKEISERTNSVFNVRPETRVQPVSNTPRNW